MNLLNEEIRVIQVTMSHIKRAIPLQVTNGERLKLQKEYDELEKLLKQKLDQCEDYTG